jgi:DNA-directed RNA polymerase specialized sigma24 family protein
MQPVPFAGSDESTLGGPPVNHIPSHEPTPAFAAQAAEEFERLLALLDDDELRSIACCKLEGFNTEEIAERLGYVPRTIERKLRLIRKIWGREIEPE